MVAVEKYIIRCRGLSGAVGLLSGLSGVGAVGTVERLSGSCRVRVSECRARAQGLHRAGDTGVGRRVRGEGSQIQLVFMNTLYSAVYSATAQIHV